MSAPEDQLNWTEWQPKPVVTRHVQFTGFGDEGNGWEILNFLHDRGDATAFGRNDVIYYDSGEREEAKATVGYWFIIGTRREVYAVTPEVHADKYQRVQR